MQSHAGNPDLLEQSKDPLQPSSAVVPTVGGPNQRGKGSWRFFSRAATPVPQQLTVYEEKQKLVMDIRELGAKRMFNSVNRYVSESAVAEMREHIAALNHEDELQRFEAIKKILQKAQTLLPDWEYANCDEDAGCGGRVNMTHGFIASLLFGAGAAAMSFYFVIANHSVVSGIWAGVDVAITGGIAYKMKNHISEVVDIKRLINDCERYISLVERPEVEMTNRL